MTATELAPLPAAHPRSGTVELARQEFRTALVNLRRQYKLTEAEYIMLLGEALGNHTAQLVALERKRG